MFERIEHIRQSSIRFRRDDDLEARRELEATLDALSRDQTLHVVRAFSYFSHLANIAEDQHRGARARLIAGSAPRPGNLAHAIGRAFEAGLEAPALASSSPAPRSARCSPPTHRGSRKSILSAARWRSPACSMRATASRSPGGGRRRRCAAGADPVAGTRMRASKLSVIGRIGQRAEASSGRPSSASCRVSAAPSRTSSPRATARSPGSSCRPSCGSALDRRPRQQPSSPQVLDEALAMQCARALGFTSTSCWLGSHSRSPRSWCAPSEALAALAERSPDTSPHHGDEPYRRAISGIMRDSGDLPGAARQGGAAPPGGRGPSPTPTPRRSLPISRSLRRSLESNGSGPLARGRLRQLRRAVAVFGFHLAPVDSPERRRY